MPDSVRVSLALVLGALGVCAVLSLFARDAVLHAVRRFLATPEGRDMVLAITREDYRLVDSLDERYQRKEQASSGKHGIVLLKSHERTRREA